VERTLAKCGVDRMDRFGLNSCDCHSAQGWKFKGTIEKIISLPKVDSKASSTCSTRWPRAGQFS